MKTVAHLNPEQHRAVTTTEGPLLVLAGAGTGKTRVVTVRIAYLLKQGASPGSILAMTFTNKAAREMRERVAELVGKKRASGVFVGTFHAFCIELLRRHGKEIGIPRFTISDGSDQVSILRGALREVSVGEVSLQPAQVLSRISLLKNRLTDRASFVESASDDGDELVGRVWERYDAHLRRTRSLDFDDILLQTLELLRTNEKVRAACRRKYRYVLVDEYQDTNGPQYEIVRAIAGGHRNLCVVGDDDQSIYGWRGADVGKILGFERDFPGAEVVKLETNYRSTKQVLDAANRVIRNNPDRHEKTLRSHAGDGEPLQLVVAEDENEEADYVVREIQRLQGERKLSYPEVAILFRTGPQARVFEHSLRARGVPYVLVGGQSFFDRKEVRDVISYLKLLVNPDDETALLRVVNCPPRGIGKASLDRILQHATTSGCSVSEAFARATEVEGVPTSAGIAAQELFRTLGTLAGRGGTLPARVRALLEAVSYRAEVERSYPDETTRQQRWTAVEEIVDFAENHERRRKRPTLETFLQDLVLEADDSADAEDGTQRNAVTLMTLHAAKGLEFPRVYLVGLEEGLLPHLRAVSEDTVEEERRLTYVGITRARRQLTLTLTRTRARYGSRTTSMPSRFLYELKGESPPADWRAAGAEPEPRTKRAKQAKKKRRRGAVRAPESYR